LPKKPAFIAGFFLPAIWLGKPWVIKNGREPFLTLRSNGPQGGRQGWQAIKSPRKAGEGVTHE
jgi:hypothetical protein